MKKVLEFIRNKKIIISLIGLIVIVITSIVAYKLISYNKEDDTCLVQFESAGGTKIQSQELIKGDKVIKPETPIKEGFEFISWIYNDEEFDFETIIYENIILNAKWKAKEDTIIYKISFDTKGGNKINSIEVSKDNTITEPISPTKEGYIFDGWYLNNERFNFDTKINKDIMLIANWKKSNDLKNNKENNKDTLLDNKNDSSNQPINNENNSNNQPVNNENNSNNQSTNNENNSNNTHIENENNLNNDSSVKYQYEKKNAEVEYGGTPTMEIGLGEKTQLNYNHGFYSYDTDRCKIVYKTNNSKVLSINSSGVAVGEKLGKTDIYICLVDKNTNKEIDSFKWHIKVSYLHGTERAIKDSNNLLNAIDGYYWYLDGYTYAYLYPRVIPWYGHKCLDWEAQYMELINNKFVTTEDTGELYYTSSNIHNKFLINPTEFAYNLIVDYNMHVSNNKLYITLGGKQYSFTKRNSKKSVHITKISLDKKEIVVEAGKEFSITATLTPAFPDYILYAESSNNSVVRSDVEYKNSNGIHKMNFYAEKPGTTVITFRDSVSGISKSINVTVKAGIINVTGITLNKSEISLVKGKGETLKATITPSNATNKKVTWKTSDSSVATVDSNGFVSAKGAGTAQITVTTDDGTYTSSCTVKVSLPPFVVDASIGYTSIFTDSGMATGMQVTAKPSGGTGNYTSYKIKLYFNGNLIGESSNKTLFVNQTTNGTYKAEVTVTDSNGETKTETKTMTKS